MVSLLTRSNTAAAFLVIFILGGVRYFLSNIEGYEAETSLALALLIAVGIIATKNPLAISGLSSESERRYVTPIHTLKSAVNLFCDEHTELLGEDLQQRSFELLEKLDSSCFATQSTCPVSLNKL